MAANPTQRSYLFRLSWMGKALHLWRRGPKRENFCRIVAIGASGAGSGVRHDWRPTPLSTTS